MTLAICMLMCSSANMKHFLGGGGSSQERIEGKGGVRSPISLFLKFYQIEFLLLNVGELH